MEEETMFKDIVFNIEVILLQATRDNPPGDMFLSEIRGKVWDTVTPEAKREFKKAGNTQRVFDKRVSGVLSDLKRRKYVIHTPGNKKEGKEPMYRLDREHPEVKRWIDGKGDQNGWNIGGFHYYDDD